MRSSLNRRPPSQYSTKTIVQSRSSALPLHITYNYYTITLGAHSLLLMSLHLPSPQDDGTVAMLTEEIVPNRSTADIARSAELAPDEHSLSSRPSNHVAFASSLQMIPETELSTQPSPTDSSQPRRRRARRRRSSRVISDILKIFSSEGRELRRMLGIVLRLLFNIVQVCKRRDWPECVV